MLRSYDLQKATKLAITNCNTLIIVAGHGIYVGNEYHKQAILQDKNWITDHPGESSYYLSHIVKGIELLLLEPNSVLMFSGGMTRKEAGKRSEAMSYLDIATRYCLNISSEFYRDIIIKTHPVEDMSIAYKRLIREDYARDSFENLLFSLLKYQQDNNRYPTKIQLISWKFKETRFMFHWHTLQKILPNLENTKFEFIGVENPVDLDMAMRGEKKALQEYLDDPLGEQGILFTKKQSRNPFGIELPYQYPCNFNAIDHLAKPV